MPRYLQCSTIGISNSLRKNEGCLILIALLLKHKVNDLEPLYNNWAPLRIDSLLTVWGPPQVSFFAYYIGGPLMSISSLTIGGPSVQFLRILYGPPPPQINFFAYYMGAP